MGKKLYSSPMPVGSRLTSPFGMRTLGGRRRLHAGADYGTPKPGTPGIPVHAVSSGRIEKVGRGNGQWNSVVAPYHSGIAVRQRLGRIGGDYMRAYYGHLDEARVNEGQYVKAGEVIGIVGGSGASGQHDFPIHLHLGIMQNATRPIHAAKSYGARGWIDAEKWLRSKGVRVGKDAPRKPGKARAVSNGSGGGASDSDDHVVAKSTLTKRLDRIGLDRRRWMKDRVASYQRLQQYGDLVVDGLWQNNTEAHYQWTRDLQAAMNKWKGDDIRVDGDCREVTLARVREVQRRNQGHAYRGKVDGVPGPVTCRMLGINKHPND